MSQTKTKSQTKACHCASNRRCDSCAERDLEALIAKCKASPRYQKEEALRDTIIISPRVSGREGRSGFHRQDKVAECETPETTEDDVKYISARVLAYREPEGESLTWCCPSCGPLTQRETPLVDAACVAHCPRMGCDAVVKLTDPKRVATK